MLRKDVWVRVVSGELTLSKRGLMRGLKECEGAVLVMLGSWLEDGLIRYRNGVNDKNGYVEVGGDVAGADVVVPQASDSKGGENRVLVHAGWEELESRVGSVEEFHRFLNGLRGSVGEGYVYVSVGGDLVVDGEVVLRGGLWRYGVLAGGGGVLDVMSGVWVCGVMDVSCVGVGVQVSGSASGDLDVENQVKCVCRGGGTVRFSRRDLGDDVLVRCGLLGVGLDMNLEGVVRGSVSAYLLGYFG